MLGDKVIEITRQQYEQLKATAPTRGMDMPEYTDWVREGEGWSFIKLTYESGKEVLVYWPDAVYQLPRNFYSKLEEKYGTHISTVYETEEGIVTETWKKGKGHKIPGALR